MLRRSPDDRAAALAGRGYRNPPRLWLVTRGVQAVGGGDVVGGPVTDLGLGRVVGMRHGSCAACAVDSRRRLPAASSTISSPSCWLTTGGGDLRGAAASGTWRASRIGCLASRAESASSRRRVEPSGRKRQAWLLETAGARATERRAPAAGEVEIAIEAAGLSFANMLRAVEVLPMIRPKPRGGRQRSGTNDGPCGGLLAKASRISPSANVFFALHAERVRLTSPYPASLVVAAAGGDVGSSGGGTTAAYVAAVHALDRVRAAARRCGVLIHGAACEVVLPLLNGPGTSRPAVFATAGTSARRRLSRIARHRARERSRSEGFVQRPAGWTDGEGRGCGAQPVV